MHQHLLAGQRLGTCNPSTAARHQCGVWLALAARLLLFLLGLGRTRVLLRPSAVRWCCVLLHQRLLLLLHKRLLLLLLLLLHQRLLLLLLQVC